MLNDIYLKIGIFAADTLTEYSECTMRLLTFFKNWVCLVSFLDWLMISHVVGVE